jgi:integrase
MKIEKFRDKYRIRRTYKGKTFAIFFDHKPTMIEAEKAMNEMIISSFGGTEGTFGALANEYIESRSNVCSPSTIRTYRTKLNQTSIEFRKLKVDTIQASDVQKEINLCSESYEPKTVKSLHGFIASVLKEYRPNLVLSTKLPQAIKKTVYEPTNKDIKRILESSKGTAFYIPFRLGVMGLRRGEICALSIEDMDGDSITIHRTMVYDDNNNWIIKESPKTEESNRTILLPHEMAEDIRKQGYIYRGHPNALNKAIHRFQKQLGIPTFKFHALRSYFASYAHSIGIPDSDIMAIGGWKTDNVMKNVYRDALDDVSVRMNKKVVNYFGKI